MWEAASGRQHGVLSGHDGCATTGSPSGDPDLEGILEPDKDAELDRID
jgi:hypothetical protein